MPIARRAMRTIAGSRATHGSRSRTRSPSRRRPDASKLQAKRHEDSRACGCHRRVRQQRVENMSETATQTRTPKTSRASVAEDNLAVGTLRTELPTSFVDVFEKSVARAKDAHEKVASIVEHSAEAFEEAFSCANRGSLEYRNKLMEIARTNADAAFDLAREVIQAKSMSEVFESALAH